MSEPTFIRVWSNETRGAAAGSKSHCRDCRQPITWFLTVANGKKVPLDGHEPVALQTARDRETNRTIEFHSRDTVHLVTCPNRTAQEAHR
jgi:hypothetical protein